MRPAFLAGSWYPSEPQLIERAIRQHTHQKPPAQIGCGVIVPHAGWAYSGDAAGLGFRVLAQQKTPEIVVVLGSHRGPMGPNTIFCGDAWDTPLGPLRCAQELAQQLRQELSLQHEPSMPKMPDNAVEVLLPFVKYFWPDARLLMLGVAASYEAIAIGDAVGSACKAQNVVIVGSTDLTHYGPNYDFEPQGPMAVKWARNVNDRGLIDQVLAGNAAGALEHATIHHSACCPGAAAAAMRAARIVDPPHSAVLLSHYLSYDVQPATSFVGYASIAL